MEDVTVFCAVWHKDPQRHALLKAHAENLRRQTLSVRVLYVFDGGDQPPDWLDSETITAKSPLTIYQAWNLALAAVRTPLVMNLNLDDRLAPDAVEKMRAELESTQSVLVGGDWRIFYSQDDTDKVVSCFPSSDIPYVPGWPPAPGTNTRLGCGLNEQVRTYGPATLWRMSVHGRIPRYPWRFSDGSLIKVIGDGAFWAVLAHMGAKLSRLPLIVGNYHSHPHEQAEFRAGDEWARLSSEKIELL